MGFQKIIIGVLILVAVLGGIYVFGSFSKNPINTAGVINPISDTETTPAPEIIGSGENVIEITSSGFSPGTLTISKGEKVTWINHDTEKHWPASASHPTHTVYPGSDISKCQTAEKDTIFDSCHGLSSGESYTFVFNEVGSWGYHDHLRANLRGTIIVQ